MTKFLPYLITLDTNTFFLLNYYCTYYFTLNFFDFYFLNNSYQFNILLFSLPKKYTIIFICISYVPNTVFCYKNVPIIINSCYFYIVNFQYIRYRCFCVSILGLILRGRDYDILKLDHKVSIVQSIIVLHKNQTQTLGIDYYILIQYKYIIIC